MREASADLEKRIRAGEAARAEEYLCRYPVLAEDAELALDVIYIEFDTRRRIAEAPPREEYFSRFPQWHAQLERQFQLDELLDETPLSHEGLANGSTSLSSEGAGWSPSRFYVLRLLARGGIGQVMSAVDTELNREVAIKELQPDFAGNYAVRERFLREAEITGKLEHPGIVPVYGLGKDAGGRPFYAMRLVRGQSLQNALVEFHGDPNRNYLFTGVDFQKFLRRFLQVCETVAFAHSRSVIHRDLKPANILLGPFGETLVVDWGLARATGPDGPDSKSIEAPPADSQAYDIRESGGTPLPAVANWANAITRAQGELIGTPAFMSPEQAVGNARRVGPASDVYSLGATLYMLLTGQAPFVGSDVRDVLARVRDGDFTRPRDINRAIPIALEAVCLKAMALRPGDRYASPRDLADDLEHWLADEPVTAADEPLGARLARWGRRHRTHVFAGMLTLVLVTVVSLIAAGWINNERLRADRERLESNRRNARLAFDRGYRLTEDHEHGAALLWFARALAHAPPDEEGLRRVILTNIDAARHYLLRRGQTFAHAARIIRSEFSEDGRRLLTIDRTGTGRLWDVELGQELSAQELANGEPVAASCAANGDALIAVHENGELLVRQLTSAENKFGPPVVIAHAEEVASAALHPRGHWLAAATRAASPAKVRLWQVADGELIAEIDHPNQVNQILFQPGTEAVATVANDGRVRLWDVPTKRLIQEIRSVSGIVQCVAFSPDGKRIFSGDLGGCVSCWDSENGRRLFDVAQHSGSVTALACATDGQTIAAAWSTGIARTWNVEMRRPASELLRLDHFATSLAFRPKRSQLIVGSERTDLVIWDIPSLETAAPTINQREVEAVAYSRDGKFAATGSSRGSARIRDGKTGRSAGKILQHRGRVRSVVFRPDGAVVLTASNDGTARMWNTSSGDAHGELLNHRLAPGSTAEVTSAAFSPAGQIIATGTNTGMVRLWDGDSGELVSEFDRVDGSTRSICFSPRGDYFAAGFSFPESGLRLWDTASGKLLWKGAHRETVRTVAFSPDGGLLISTSNDDTARFWDVRSGQPIGQEMVHRGEVFAAAFSPDGRLAVTGGYDATVRLWDVPSGRPVGEPMRHEGMVFSTAFSSDGTRLLTGSADRTARLWDVATCLPLSPPLLHLDYVPAVAISPTADVAITGRVWRLPRPLPDDPALVETWVKLATERSLTGDDNLEWLDRASVDELSKEFQGRAGQSWQAWAEDVRSPSAKTDRKDGN